MISISSEILRPRSPLPGVWGSVVRAVILSEDAASGEHITPDKNYIAFEEGVFTEKG